MGGDGFGWRVRWARDRVRLTQDVLAERAAISRSWLARIEGGHGTPSLADALALHRVLAEGLADLSLEWLLAGGEPQTSSGRRPETGVRRYDGRGAQADSLALEAPQETPMDRSTFLRGSIGLALMAASADPVVQAIAHLCSFEGRLAGETVDGFDELVADFGHDYSRRPPLVLVAQLQAALPPLTQLIAVAPPSYRGRLQSAAGWLATLLANALYDAGETTAAKVQARAAYEHGQRAGDSRLMAFTRYKQAMFASDAGDVAVALRYVGEALAVAPPDTAITCRLLAFEADYHVRLAQREAAAAALREVELLYERLPAPEVGNGSFNVSSVFVPQDTGKNWGRLGDTERAERDARQVIAHYAGLEGEARRPTRLAGAQLNLANVMLQMGRPDEACATAAMALGSERMVHGLLRDCRAFDTALAGGYPDLPEARDFHERYLALSL